jgi:hypothetical protein
MGTHKINNNNNNNNNVELQELLFGHDNFLFCKADGLHYEINS